ncbi:hypothetical protein D1BOALGB6SA_9448 [Olavius sp. associated proteobacterium Delta 1]|nr:hypothetical protein D1BOALGB6SA_9448 [Olavius sp. associated proteobacterium Delta 1]
MRTLLNFKNNSQVLKDLIAVLKMPGGVKWRLKPSIICR